MTNFALIHSPLAGPSTWKPVAALLQRLGHASAVPALADSDRVDKPYWQQDADSAARSVQAVFQDADYLLVAHSGAGPLLPAIVDRLARPPLGLIYVDAGLPASGSTRLDLMRMESSEMADKFKAYLKEGGLFPDWSDADLRNVISDDVLRAQTIAELRPRGLAFFTEPILFSNRWESLPQGYLQFSTAYEIYAQKAQASGWPFLQITAGHFHMLVGSKKVAEALVTLAGKILK